MKESSMNRRQKAANRAFRASGKTSSCDVAPAIQKYIEDKLCEGRAYACKNTAWCGYCGEFFPCTAPEDETVICPHCGRPVKVFKTRARHFDRYGYLQELTTIGGYQALRMYQYNLFDKVGRKRWVGSKLVYVLMFDEGNFLDRYRFSVPLKQFYYRFQDPWGYGKLELRSDNTYFHEDPCRGWYADVYPRMKLLPWMEKYDLRGDHIGLDLYETLLKIGDNKKETVWKLRHKNKDLSRVLLESHNFTMLYDAAIIALRHGYKIEDAKMWADHIEMLHDEHKDIHNPHFICPDNLQEAHQRLIDIKERRRAKLERERRLQEQIRREKERLKREKEDKVADKKYAAHLGKALGIVISSGDIEIRPLQNVNDFFQEGMELNHCVYSNSYYKKPGIIIFGAKVAGKRTETIEVNVRQLQIAQCRGRYNQDSPYHAKIMKLMNANLDKVRPYAKQLQQPL